ncbi:MAG: hypothetical protein KGN16_13010 [Burkholderiales bacterium]|nr:hypothetical protein [Burkholderiales bacterium]
MMMKAPLLLAGFTALCLAAARAPATPITPHDDAEVVETLPADAARAQDKRLRRLLEAAPRDAGIALAAARRDLERARTLGDPRYAGHALAAIAPWTDVATMPPELLLMRATLQQYLHDFDGAAELLERLTARPPTAVHAQALLTLATVRRVQGRYDASDVACRRLPEFGADLYARACLAENAGLRGQADAARRTLQALLAAPGLPREAAAWLTTTLAELEQRAGHGDAADRAYRRALELDADGYTKLAYADFLIDERRPAEALAALAGEVRSDAVLLRLAIAGAAAGAPAAAADAAELRARIAQANLRPEAVPLHAREQAMFALQIEHRADLALALARGDVQHQREPLDLLVLARAARAAASPAALGEARSLVNRMNLHDHRIDALL